MFGFARNTSSALVPVSKQSSRYASRGKKVVSKFKKVDIQLLKDHPTLGQKGEVVSVKAGFMRQQLHPFKYASYTLNGLRIPVVEKKVAVVNTPPVVTSASIQKPSVGSFNKEDFSALFDTLKTSGKNKRTSKSEISFESINESSSSEGSFSASEIREYVPSVITLVTGKGVSLPVTKAALATHVFNVSGLEIPQSAIRIADSSKKPITSIEAAGEYSWVIDTPENLPVRISLTVQ
ncbi:hypothetical protein PSN45_005229 [Yamadazyma tenuis]|uniref:Ribosomal protein L9 domain-containing protein n=1 Tax=Candida tenuis (strain ATCC 10573 / BCRC 21748 / CBS 615 / JCM 9827 / NBRC 10315 / NRRL Y-1498 / VKM Y-70) TaxID=590646 RepID=G3B147_CANTC|nr:uncharacterized protein CANTEDRAFT_113638 [Yamadazyma tenuis ATCC 10573]EGV64876.1 hypothetical protein CANTEDRAFT_113638 [Yamadazyma tenuis ATCC 10573]WEJ97671.1 hypothetical protein PSN45_005229 [Yamadazyma tenuis]